MVIPNNKRCFDYDLIEEETGKSLRIYTASCTFPSSIEDSPLCMSKVVDLLVKISGVTSIILVGRRDYVYDYNQTMMLDEIAQLFKRVIREDRYSYKGILLHGGCGFVLTKVYASFKHIIFSRLKEDPLGAYVELRRLYRNQRIELEETASKKAAECISEFSKKIVELLSAMEKTQLISSLKRYMKSYTPGDRSHYKDILSPSIKPDFMYTKITSKYPIDGEVIDNYEVKGTEVTVFKFNNNVKNLYHVIPPEFKLDEDKYEILDSARSIMAEHKPSKEDFVNPARMREVFYRVGYDLIEELTVSKRARLREKEISSLANILLRYTVGFGLIEVLLADEKVQDISVNSPPNTSSIFIVHADFDDCYTNIYPTREEVDSWATKLRLTSGRPLDEANPMLDTEIHLEGVNARVAAISPPLDPSGIAFSFRRHRSRPWTLPLFMNAGMLNSTAAGLLSFLIDGTRTMLIAGTRSSGKTSLLGSLLVEIMRRYRIITIEDTLELPVRPLIDMGFNIQQMKVASALSTGGTEVSATQGIRTTLRLGDSALIIGEVRSEEAKSLYEAMRVGAAANVVAGTIHGASPYGVFDRVVNDIGVPRTSFKATDIIMIANPVKSASGIKKKRRVLQITEVRKRWQNDPAAEGGFVDLMKYNPSTDQLDISDELMNGESEVLKDIAGSIKEFAGNWDALWENILLRGRIKEEQLTIANKVKDAELLEAPFTIHVNDTFHRITDEVKEETGEIDTKRILFEFKDWIRKEVKKRAS